MRKALRILGIVLGVALVAVAGFAIWVQLKGIPHYEMPHAVAAPIATTPALVDHGQKLVMASCADCHLNRQTNSLSGHRLQDLPPEFGTVFSANITQDPTHGIGRWTDTELVTLLRTGIGRDGRYRVVMPSFVQMSDDDVSSILAFLHSNSPMVQPDATPTREQQPSFMLKALTNTVMKPTPMPTAAVVAPAPTDAVAYGRYLVVGRYKCYDCHSKDFKTNNAMEPEKSEGYLGGGNVLLNTKGEKVLSRNITPDAETGIGDWTEAQFAQSLRFGSSPHGPLAYPMPKYSQLSDQEAHAIFAYLQSVPKIRNATPEDGALAAR